MPGRYGGAALDGPNYDEWEYVADPADCRPLASLVGSGPVATVNRQVELGEVLPAPGVDVPLRSYEKGSAEKVLSDLGKAGIACADGFTEDRTLAEATVEKVEAPAFVDHSDLVDASVSYRLHVQDVADPALVLTGCLTVLRAGSTTMAFRLESMGEKDREEVPAELIEAQLDRYAQQAAS